MKADDQEQRLQNALIYGTSHPEAYMTKADELWEKYAAHRGNGYPTMDKPDFLAALAEYGEHFKSEEVKVCEPRTKRPCDCETCDCGNSGNLQAVTFWDEANYCAAAIEKMPLP